MPWLECYVDQCGGVDIVQRNCKKDRARKAEGEFWQCAASVTVDPKWRWSDIGSISSTATLKGHDHLCNGEISGNFPALLIMVCARKFLGHAFHRSLTNNTPRKTMRHFSQGLILICLISQLSSCQKYTQQGKKDQPPRLPAGSTVWTAFYNVENLFDTDDDPGKDDAEYLPGSELDWTPSKYLKKLDNLSLAIMGMNNGKGPDLLGLAEVENAQTLKDWSQMTDLKSRQYQFILEEGPDPRGIDVAFMYDPKVFAYTGHKAYVVDFPEESDYVSRLVLRVDGTIQGDPISVLVNHWPSRYGGATESEPRRMAAAKVARRAMEERAEEVPKAGFLIMGDFNDDPLDRSLIEGLGVKTQLNGLQAEDLYSPHAGLHQPDSVGTLTYRGQWNLFDQIIVSANLLDKKGALEYIPESAGIHNPQFMQVGGDGGSRYAPRRAIYRGEFQENGFSDHFPVYLRLRVR